MLNLNDDKIQYVILMMESIIGFCVSLYNTIVDFNYFAYLGVIYSSVENTFTYVQYYISRLFLCNVYLN